MVIKRLKIPARVLQIEAEAQYLLKMGLFSASINRFAIYIQQTLIIMTLFILREVNIQIASEKIEEMTKMVSRRGLTMGKAINYCKHMINNSGSEELLGKMVLVSCDDFSRNEISDSFETLRNIYDKTLENAKKISTIRNEISEHPGFVIFLDPSNQFKKGMYDANYYRKFVGRKLKFLEKMGIPCQSIIENSNSIFRQHPLTLLPKLEDLFDELSKQIEQTSASVVASIVTEIDCLFTILVTNVRTH